MENPDLNELTRKIEKWGDDVGISSYSTPYSQYEKTLEEINELAVAIQESNQDEIKDALGDIYVTLVMQSVKWGLAMEECVQSAYDIIKNRKGVMLNGQFVKDHA
jgi:NTP pyrophosphatase (non-canonical NTP hydrolase)